MTGPRIPTVHPHRTRARRLLPFLTAILLIGQACTEQPTAPQSPGAGPVAAAARKHPYLASKSGQTASATASMQMAMAKSSLTTAASNLASIPGPKVLILSDVDGPATTALANSIVSAGFHVGLLQAPEYNWFATNPALDGYDVVIHLNGFTYNLPLAANAQSALQTFVNNGGGFVGSQWNGYEEVAGQQTGMPELVLLGVGDWQSDACGPCDVTYTTVAGQESHPVLAGIPAAFTFYADGHDASPKPTSGSATIVLMRSPSGGPAVLVRQVGSGKVVNFSFAPNYADVMADRRTLQDANVQQLYVNAVRWISGSQGNADGGTLDRDADGTIDGTDNCIDQYNPAQFDNDGDGQGDVCDPDDDGDGVTDDVDNCELPNPDQLDVNENWVGDACEVVSTQPQTITFDPLVDRTYGDAPFTISASATSGLPVTFLVMGPCSLSGTTVSINGAGTCTIVAQQAGNESWTFAPDVSRSFTVAKAAASITLGTEFTYDGTVKQSSVLTSPAGLTGVTVTYSLGGVPVSEPVNAGVYQVLATLDNPNYVAAPTTGTLTIHPAAPVINWSSPAPISEGTPLGATQLNATATGVSGAALTGTFVYLPAEGTVLAAGTRSLSVEFIPGSGNYARAIATVTITVTAVETPPSRLEFTGFFQPVYNLPAVNLVKAGRAVVVRFSVRGGLGAGVLQSGSPSSVLATCPAGSALRPVEETSTASASRLRVSGSTYTYVWKTRSDWAGSCRKLVVTLVDGSRHEALFRFAREAKVKPGIRGRSQGDARAASKGKQKKQELQQRQQKNK